MIAQVKGELVEAGDGYVVLMTGGIGFKIFVPMGRYAPYFSIGEEMLLYTYLSVTQDALQLYGLFTADERALFGMLLTVSGVGPKAALGILSALSADELRYAIVTNDAASISRAPGIGKKTAQKVILELHDRIDAQDALAQSVEAEIAGGAVETGVAGEAVEALIALGIRPAEARTAVRRAAADNPAADVETILKEALKEL